MFVRALKPKHIDLQCSCAQLRIFSCPLLLLCKDKVSFYPCVQTNQCRLQMLFGHLFQLPCLRPSQGCGQSKQADSVCLYRRHIGRWLTDVTPLMPLLTGQQCHFHMQTAPWALTWTPSLTLRFTNTTHPRPMNPNPLQLRSISCHAEEEDPVSRLPRKLQSAPSSDSAGAIKSSLAALPLPDTSSVHVRAQGTLAPAVSTNHQQMTNAMKPKDDITALEQQQAAQSAVTAARQQQEYSLTHTVQNKPTAASTSVMPGQQAGSRLPAKPAGLPFRAAGAKKDAAGAKPDAAGAKTDAATPPQSQDVPFITATSPSVSPANADASPAKSETAQQPGAEQSQEADMTAPADVAVRRPKPHSIVPLFDGGDFDAGYNDKYEPVEFVTPAGLQKAVLEAVITGVLGMRLNPLLTHASCVVRMWYACGTLVVCMWYACGTHVVRVWKACGTHVVRMCQCCQHGPA